MTAVTVYKGEIIDFEIVSEQSKVNIATQNEAISVTIYNTNFRLECFEHKVYPFERGLYSVIIERVGPIIDPQKSPKAIINF